MLSAAEIVVEQTVGTNPLLLQSIILATFGFLAFLLYIKITASDASYKSGDAADDNYIEQCCLSLPTLQLPPKPDAVPDGVDWLGVDEYYVLQAIIDTLHPGFIGDDRTLLNAAHLVTMNVLGRGYVNAKDEAHILAGLRKVVPTLRRPASALDVAGEVAKLMQRTVPPSKLAAVKGFLRALNSAPGSLILCGCMEGWDKLGAPFPELSFSSRHRIVKSWQFSVLPPLRDLFNAFKRLSGHLYYSNTNEDTDIIAGRIKAKKVRELLLRREAAAAATAAAAGARGGKAGDNDDDANGDDDEGEGTGDGDGGQMMGIQNPNWVAIGYESRERVTQGDKVPNREQVPLLKITPITKDATELAVDVVIVGSGAGGGTAAGVLTAAGFTVAVLEKGYQYGPEEYAKFNEAEGMSKLYELEGAQGTEDGTIAVFSGATVGGGTVINWNASFRTPKHVREEWVKRFGLESFAANGKFDEALDAVCEKGNVNIGTSHSNADCPGEETARYNLNNELLWRGAKAIGNKPLPVPRNVKSCVDCGHCNHGCPYNAKQGTTQTWLADAQKTGKLTLIEGASVDKVIIENGVAKGVTANVTVATTTSSSSSTNQDKVVVEEEEKKKKTVYRLTVRAKVVVLAGGAIHTPAIMLRSGLKHRKLGKHLRLHPVTAAVGLLPGQCTEQFRGVPMGVYVRETMVGPAKDGYGCVIETPPGHPGVYGSSTPFINALATRPQMTQFASSASFVAICRDDSCESNRVQLGEGGVPQIIYNMTRKDTRTLQHGQEEAMWMLVASGATYVVSSNLGGRYTPVESNVMRTDKPLKWEQWKSSKGTGTEQDKEKNGGDGELEKDKVIVKQQEEEVVKVRAELKAKNRMVAQMIAKGKRLGFAFKGNGGLFSAHQMGTVRLSSNETDGPLKETGESWEVKNLYVADASTFPTSLGINPMITVQAIAYMVAGNVCTALGKGPPSKAALGVGEGGAVKSGAKCSKPSTGKAGTGTKAEEGVEEEEEEDVVLVEGSEVELPQKKKVLYPEGPTLFGDYGVSPTRLAW